MNKDIQQPHDADQTSRNSQIVDNVKAYYGSVLDTNEDLKTSVCCPSDAQPPYIQALLNNIHPAVQETFLCLTPSCNLPPKNRYRSAVTRRSC